MIELAGIPVDGVSVGGLETCIQLPSHGLCFDIGRCPPGAVGKDKVLFTHTHMDHMGGAAYHAATRSLRNMRPPIYLVPREEVDRFEAMFAAWRDLDRSDLEHTTVPIGPGEEYQLRPGLLARPFRSVHVVPTQGYGLWSRRMKLRPEYQGFARQDLQRMREKEGIEITHPVDTPEVVFTGDTRIDVLEREEVVRKARLLIMEVTFLDDRVSVDLSRAKGHVHLDEVIERADLFENEAILFTHFSARYRPEEVRSILAERLPDGLRERVTPFLC